ncbi:hypothetical protein BGZ76_008456 [Entomortierella beljakovae]|nr:hypothetical protein BGZ76_008456 [Entomortierella beljakovae]
MNHQHSKAERFANVVTSFPGLRILWAIFTFGYSFPRRRKGENLPLCIFKTAIILIFRFTCVIGAVWYINDWRSYSALGKNRPFNVLERQEIRNEGTPVPMLSFYSGSQGNLRIRSVSYTSKSNRKSVSNPVDFAKLTNNDTISNDVGDELLYFNLTGLMSNMSAGNRGMGSLEVELIQTQLPTQFKWVELGILHPWENPYKEHFTQEDHFNQYYFLPGNLVEIRYIPLKTIEPQTNANTTRDKFMSFFGFAKDISSYSYRSTINISPLPVGMYDSATTTVISIRPQANVEIISYKEEKVRFRDMLSKIGGLMSTIGGAIAFLFGASLLSPWGFIAGLAFFRRRISGSLAKAYDTGDGLSKGPFTTPFEDTGKFPPNLRSQEEKITMLKERIDELEMVLKEFYLDGGVFEDYGSERIKLKIKRSHSTATRATGKASLDFDPEQAHGQTAFQRVWGDSREPLTLPSQTLMESQHQHKGQLPSPQFPPSYQRQSQDHTRRHSAEPSVLNYYQQQREQKQQEDQQQQQQQYQHHARHFSDPDKNALGPVNEEDEDASRGLLQRDHHAMHHMFLQQQDRRLSQNQNQNQNPYQGQNQFQGGAGGRGGAPIFPPRPSMGSASPIKVYDPLESTALPNTNITSRNSGNNNNNNNNNNVNNSSSSWWKNNKGSRPTSAPGMSIVVSPTIHGDNGIEERRYEHVDLTDFSKMRREE